MKRGAALAALLVALMCGPAAARDVTVATISPDLVREGPGLLLRDLRSGDDPEVAALVELLGARAPDAVLLTGFDWDLDAVALRELAGQLRAQGLNYPHHFAPRPNSGLATDLDLDGDGRRGGPGDAQGWGAFPGWGGLALLSRWPLGTAAVQDFTDLLWTDLPGATLPVTEAGTPFPSAQAQAVQRLSSTGHWSLPVDLPQGDTLWLAAFAATPPLFDGAEQRNVLRNADEIRLWSLWLDGALPTVPPDAPVVLLGRANTDPRDGAGMHSAIAELLAHPRLQDPAPGTDTARFTPPPEGPGDLRINYVLPDRRLTLEAAGTDWHPDLRHALVWVTLRLPD